MQHKGIVGKNALDNTQKDAILVEPTQVVPVTRPIQELIDMCSVLLRNTLVGNRDDLASVTDGVDMNETVPP